MKWVDWEEYDTDKTIYEISDMPNGAVGFVYLITYVDNMLYIGKKNLYTRQRLPVLKSGKSRVNALEKTYRIVNGHRKHYEIVKKESNWKTYNGSHAEAKIRVPKKREILQYAFSNQQLTYLETKWLFETSALERLDFINDNILGKFYRSNIFS